MVFDDELMLNGAAAGGMSSRKSYIPRSSERIYIPQGKKQLPCYIFCASPPCYYMQSIL